MNFYFILQKNGTSEDIVTINTGENDTNMIGIIERINGKSKLDIWGTDECNRYKQFDCLLLYLPEIGIICSQALVIKFFRIDATQGFIFPPSKLDRKQTIYVYNNEICRKFPFTYEKDVKVCLIFRFTCICYVINIKYNL